MSKSDFAAAQTGSGPVVIAPACASTVARNLQSIPPMHNAGSAMRPEQVAARVGVEVKTLANWRWRGVGPAFIKLGSPGGRGAVRYEASEIEAWLGSCRQTGER
jgi:predicted DNA-binding transcriptional regulator AlpA